MMSFSVQKQVEIEKIQKINKVLDKIVSSPVSLLESNELIDINNLLEKNKDLINKLQKDEFEIAIVGLEKAGKSTFANALIKANILPSAPERCTFTSTKLKYSPEDKAKITFYTKEEFNNIFRSMLKDLEYPNADHVDFLSLSLSEFEEYFNSLEEKNSALYKEHVGKTNEEIIDILRNKQRINSLLNREPIEFRGSALNSDEFKSYITGIRLENGYTDTSRPRAVKSLEIFSSNLQALKTAVIYDVPGFDSPTKIHERQTLERLRKADIIILVTNAGRNPSLVGTQLNIITKNTDEDGIPLRDKLFVFGNQIDLVNDESHIERNKTTLINDVLKYKIGVRERVYIGSAYKYLVDNGLIQDSNYNCRFNISSGIDEIREGIIEYYKNDRFEILKRRIEHIKEETINLRNKLKEKFDSDFDIGEIEKRKFRIILDEVERIKRDIKNELDKIRSDVKFEIYNKRYFSNKFRENIENDEYFPELTNELFDRIKRAEDKTVSTAESPEAVNDGIRETLYEDYLDKFVDLILNITDKEAEKLHDRIIKAVAKVIVNRASFDTKKLETEVEEFMKDLNSEIMHNRGRFLYLIERFSRPVFDGLILRRVLSEDRKDIYKKFEKEFKYLDSYYSNGEGKLLRMILGGNENGVKKVIKSAAKGFNRSISKNPIQREIIDNLIDSVLSELKKATTDDEIIEEINRDIESLKKILSKAVIEAVFLELAFLNSLDKEIKILMDSFENRDSGNLSKFNKFISDIVYKLKQGEIEAINFEVEQNRLKKEIVEDLFSIGI
jgi:GTPase SAR1 family protein